MNIFLCGFQGVGKTHFGKMLSRKIEWEFFDTDDLIVGKTQCGCIRRMYAEKGEEAFRCIEEVVVGELCSKKQSVIALGGGALLSKKAQTEIPASGRLVYLYQDQETVSKRLLKSNPPYLQGHDFSAFFQRRHTDFVALAHDVICVDLYKNNEILERLHHGK